MDNPLKRTSKPKPQAAQPEPQSIYKVGKKGKLLDEVKTVGTSIKTSEAEWLQQWANDHGGTLGSLLSAMLRRSAEELKKPDGWRPPKKNTKFLSEQFTPKIGDDSSED